jgi:hypothetical protein
MSHAFIPKEIQEKIFAYATTLQGIAKILQLNTAWNKLASKLFEGIVRHKWLASCVESYLVAHDWRSINWNNDFSMYFFSFLVTK